MAQNCGTKINFVLKLLTILMHLLGILTHNHLELLTDLIHSFSFELRYRANNRNILSCKKKKKHILKQSYKINFIALQKKAIIK